MVVQHNMQALNANRMLGITQGLQAKSTEKLASGYQINRAADDAAGLSISEKMRKQIKGLDQAATNAQDGISSVQTAEGALTEVHSMLQRMNELAVQAANGTNSESDRQSIQDEIDQLTTEIDRVAETTKFNETYLLKGNGKDTTVKIGAKDAGIAGELTGVGTGNATFKMDELKTGEQITIGSKGYTIGSTKEEIEEKIDAKVGSGTARITIAGTEYTVDGAEGAKDDFGNNKISLQTAKDLVADGKKVIVGEETFVTMTDGTDLNTYKATADIQDEIAALTDGDTVKIGDVEFTVSSGGTAGFGEEADTTGTAGAVAGALTLSDATTITIGGNGYTVTTGATNTAAGVVSSAGLAGILAQGDVVEYDGKTYTVDAQGGAVSAAVPAVTEATAESIADLLNDADKVTITVDETDEVINYVAGNAPDAAKLPDGIGDNDASVISKEQAYKLIAEELASAGSIGADPGSEAKITSVKVGEDGAALANDATDEEIAAATDALYSIADGKVTFKIEEGEVETKQGLQFSLHVGADADENNKIALTIDSMDSASLGVKGINIVDNTGAKATYAIDSIADAVAKVSAQRSALGAVQNRLEHTIANLDNVVENTTSAESSIRDTDMASEMVNYSKNNILAQAGQAMLAQANNSNQGVLSLLG